MNRPLIVKILAVASIIVFLFSIGLSLPTRAATFTPSATYTLRFSGYDFDGQNEIALSLNGVLIAQFPAIFVTMNAAKYVSFYFGPFALLNGNNQIRFTHSSIDQGVPDYVKDLSVTSSLGQVVYSNSSIYPTVSSPLVYSFNPFTASPAPPPAPSPPVNSTGTGTIGGSIRLNLSPGNFTMTGLVSNQSRTVNLNLTNTGSTMAGLSYTLNLGSLPGGSLLQLGSCGQGPIGTLQKTLTVSNKTYTNPCVLDPKGVALLLTLSAGYMDMLALTVTPGPAATTGSVYTFGITVKGR